MVWFVLQLAVLNRICTFYGINSGAYDDFYDDFHILIIGGPQFCQGSFQRNYTNDVNSSPRIDVVLCGVPVPIVQAEFIGQKLNVLSRTVNSYLHNYTLELPQLNPTVCGKELTITVTGYNGTLTDKIKIYMSNCKYDYCVDCYCFNPQKILFSKI